MVRIQTDKFLKLCKEADIPMTRAERAILKEVNGDKDRFLKRCKEEHIFLTMNEKVLLDSTPLEGEDDIIYVDDITVGQLKMEIGMLRARKIKEGNKRDGCGDTW